MIKMNSETKSNLFITVLWIVTLIINIFNAGDVKNVLLFVLASNCIQSLLKFFEGVAYEE